MSILQRAFSLALHDQKLRYRRAVLGPLWITITNGLVFAVIGIVFSQVLKTPAETFIPYFAVGQVCWNFFALHVSESAHCMIAHEAVIKNSPQPHYLYVLRVLFRNLLYLAHSFVSLLFVFLVFPASFTFTLATCAMSLLGLLLLAVYAWCGGLLLSLFATRWRDVLPLVQNVLTVGYLVTPVLWRSENVSAEYRWLIQVNPLAPVFDMIRAPVVAKVDAISNVTVLASVGFAVVLLMLSTVVFRRFRRAIAFWL
jgi:ABC-type polysaccharide/polyol phosphate export permease